MFMENPFQRSEKIPRSPIKGCTSGDSIITDVPNIIVDDDRHVDQLKYEEEKDFVDLGDRLNTMESIASEAKNVHKSIRDNLKQALALYQKIKASRESIAIADIICLPSPVTGTVRTASKAVQTERVNSNPKNKQPTQKEPKSNATATKSSEATPDESTVNESTWTTVQNRKQGKKKKAVKKRIKIRGEALTIKAPESSYAEILKNMKTKIDPEEVGVNIKYIRRTREGDLLVELAKGEGQAKKLENAIKNSLGDDLQVKTLSEKHLLEIKDMEESTTAEDIIKGLTTVVGVSEREHIKVHNIRVSYSGTKQAIVQISARAAAIINKKERVKISWINCRVKMKIPIKRCYRCMETGHIARMCNGKDRSNSCRKCGNDGHKAKECKNSIRCIICADAGRQKVNHYIGSTAACNNKK